MRKRFKVYLSLGSLIVLALGAATLYCFRATGEVPGYESFEERRNEAAKQVEATLERLRLRPTQNDNGPTTESAPQGQKSQSAEDFFQKMAAIDERLVLLISQPQWQRVERDMMSAHMATTRQVLSESACPTGDTGIPQPSDETVLGILSLVVTGRELQQDTINSNTNETANAPEESSQEEIERALDMGESLFLSPSPVESDVFQTLSASQGTFGINRLAFWICARAVARGETAKAIEILRRYLAIVHVVHLSAFPGDIDEENLLVAEHMFLMLAEYEPESAPGLRSLRDEIETFFLTPSEREAFFMARLGKEGLGLQDASPAPKPTEVDTEAAVPVSFAKHWCQNLANSFFAPLAKRRRAELLMAWADGNSDAIISAEESLRRVARRIGETERFAPDITGPYGRFCPPEGLSHMQPEAAARVIEVARGGLMNHSAEFLRLVLATAIYRAERGEYPEGVETLAPEYLDAGALEPVERGADDAGLVGPSSWTILYTEAPDSSLEGAEEEVGDNRPVFVRCRPVEYGWHVFQAVSNAPHRKTPVGEEYGKAITIKEELSGEPKVIWLDIHYPLYPLIPEALLGM